MRRDVSSAMGSFPKRTLLVISKIEIALTNMVLLESSMMAKRPALNLGSANSVHSKICVSSRRFNRPFPIGEFFFRHRCKHIRHFENSLPCTKPARFTGRRVRWGHKHSDWLVPTRNKNALSVFSSFKQFRKLCFGFMGCNSFHGIYLANYLANVNTVASCQPPL